MNSTFCKAIIYCLIACVLPSRNIRAINCSQKSMYIKFKLERSFPLEVGINPTCVSSNQDAIIHRQFTAKRLVISLHNVWVLHTLKLFIPNPYPIYVLFSQPWEDQYKQYWRSDIYLYSSSATLTNPFQQNTALPQSSSLYLNDSKALFNSR